MGSQGVGYKLVSKPPPPLRTLSPGSSISSNPRENCFEEARGDLEYTGVLQQSAGSGNKRLLLIK